MRREIHIGQPKEMDHLQLHPQLEQFLHKLALWELTLGCWTGMTSYPQNQLQPCLLVKELELLDSSIATRSFSDKLLELQVGQRVLELPPKNSVSLSSTMEVVSETCRLLFTIQSLDSMMFTKQSQVHHSCSREL